MNSTTPAETTLLRLYVSSTDLLKRTPVHEALAYAAKRYGMAGCSVYKGLMGYGSRTNLSAPKFWEIEEKVPIIVEIIDKTPRIESFLQKLTCWLDQLPHGCLVISYPIDIRLGSKKR